MQSAKGHREEDMNIKKLTGVLVVLGAAFIVQCRGADSKLPFDLDYYYRLNTILDKIRAPLIERPLIPDNSTIESGKRYLYAFPVRYDKAWDCFETVRVRSLNPVQKARAELFLAQMYYVGWGVPVDYAKAYGYLQNAAHQKYDDWSRILAILGLAEMLYLGQFVEVDYVKSLNYFCIVSEQKHIPWARAHAWIRLGQMYEAGKGTFKDRPMAFNYYQEAFRQEVNMWAKRYAELLLADYSYRAGNLEAAYRYYEHSVEQNGIGWVVAHARLKLGERYPFDGNYGKKKYFFELAASQNDAPDARAAACVHLGDLYYTGQGVEKDMMKALNYYEQAAKQQSSPFWRLEGWRGVCKVQYETNPCGSEKYFERFIEGDADAESYVCGLLRAADDYKSTVDFQGWYDCLTIAINQKFNETLKVQAYTALGMTYFYGFGPLRKPDYQRAADYFKQAIEVNAQGKKIAPYTYLGTMYLEGLGVVADSAQAISYFKQAISYYGKPEEKIRAYGSLARIYWHGIGVRQDLVLAREYEDLARAGMLAA